MAEKFLIILDADRKWALGADSMQWIIYKINTSKGKEVFQGRSFISGDRGLFQRCFREDGVNLSTEAEAAIAKLPFTFKEFAEIYNPRSGKGRKATDGPKAPVVSIALAKWNGYIASKNQENRKSPHRTGTALAREWFIGFDAYLEGDGEPHKPTPRSKAVADDKPVSDPSEGTAWWNKRTYNLPAHMILDKPRKY